MANNVRSVDFLPPIFQTPVNKQFLAATLDQLIQEPKFKQTQGFVGRRVGPGVNANDQYVIEPTKSRTDYQLEPGVIQVDPNNFNKIVDAITYPGLNDAIKLQGGVTTDANSLYTSDYYTWDPFVDFDKFVNFAQYFWLPNGPDAVDVSSVGIPITDDFTVTRANGVYTFSGYTGNNPTITLVKGGSYNFNVAQNDTVTVEYRVTNKGTSAYVVDYSTNPTLTFTRGNTYTFNLSLTGLFPFYIKTLVSLGTVNVYSEGVLNNGATEGLITFTVPYDAPDTLYYCASNETNMYGQLNIIDAVPGTGPGFWIQTDPGINGRIPATPNISSRDVLGVVNNGIDLGTVTFNVPLNDAQSFYYNLENIGTVDLITTLEFNQLNNVYVDDFLAANPDGIDGITNLNGRTLVFDTTTDNGWEISTRYDPLVRTSPPYYPIQSETIDGVPALWINNISYDVDGQPFDAQDFNIDNLNVYSGSPDPLDGFPGSFDSLPFDQATYITDPSIRYSIWQVNYVPDSEGRLYISLTSTTQITNLQKFTILFGQQYASTQWYKNAEGYFQEIPLLTADKNLLFYQDGADPEIFGQIRLIEESLSDTIDVSSIIGKKTYTSPNGVTFTNGMKIVFRGSVNPASYENNEYYIESVGTAIQLLPVVNFVTPETYTQSASVPYDLTTYDNGNFDGTLNAPLVPDYLTINRASPDLNAWTRSNRWFHVDVINASAAYNNTVPVLDNNFRARRPVLEFRAGTKLFDFGTQGKQPVNIIDFNATDALTTINGSIGYSTDGYKLITGSRIIFAGDADPLVRNQIYQVEFITPDTVPPLIAEPIINLVPASDSTVLVDQTVVCLDGITLQGVTFRYDGVEWIQSQQKVSVNQPPKFDVYDANGISFGDRTVYTGTNFYGSSLFSYAISSNAPDLVLGFPITYLSLTNIGDIVFDNNLYSDFFNYTLNNVGQTVPLSTGFVYQYSDRTAYTREIGWQTAATKSLVRQQFQFVYDGSPVQLDVAVSTNTTVPAIQVFINATFQESYNYRVSISANTTTITWLTAYNPGDLIEIDVLSDQTSAVGFYQVPINLENNPLNGNSSQFTLGTIRNHYSTIAQNLIELSGPVIGANNTRDLGNIVPYGLQILQQSSPLTLAGYFMRDANYDIFASLEFNNREYIKFKSQLLDTVVNNDYTGLTIPEILDSAISQINLGRTSLNPFYWSDMLPTGTVFTSTVTTVTQITTAVFNTLQTYTYTSANYLGLLVYLNGVLLTRGYDYVVSTDSPRLTISVPLKPGDVVTINEYSTTTGNFVPNTPTKLGLYPKFKPEIFLDVDYINPTAVIQGHDGSITVAFGDFRDQILLEFETRIYNNLKTDDNPVPLTADDVIPGFFRTTDYSQANITNILGESFLSWTGYNKLDYKTQNYFVSNPFTYNYSSAGNKLNGEPLLGAWRGIYRYFYDTLTPNLTPWEMLGFSEMPAWWENRYGPAPYTNGNLVLWGDLELGLVADPVAPYVLPNYVRPGLTKVIPVDSEGNLLSPLDSVVGAYDPTAWRKSWVVGDGGPTEAAWWSSSSYPFAIMRLLAVTRPAEFFSLFADRDLYKYSAEFDQYLYNGRYRINAGQLAPLYGSGTSKASYIDWIIDYNQQLGINSSDALTTDLSNIDVRLCYRMAAFTDKQYASIYLEKSSPESQNSSLLLPPESWNLLVYKNQPFDEIIYSSIIIEQMETGFSVYGYSNTQPYFPILASSTNGLTQTINAGGVTVQVPAQYTNNVVQIPYGYNFSNITIVVDFILSYGALLTAQGLTFDNVENGYVLNWKQMAQEFLYWANQGWAPGAIININPAATKLSAYRPGAVVDTIVSLTPENMLLDQNKQNLATRDLIILRDGDSFSVTSATNQTISYLDMRFTNYENMAVLDNVSIFNDLIYDPITGERQNRVALSASITPEWNGTLNAQGFILNENNVKAWQPNTKYTKGEIVIYKNTYWSALNIVQPAAQFNYADWVKSNYNLIQQGLLPNIANKADQQANSYNIYDANLEPDNDLLAYGLIGWRPRQYMVDLNLDNVSQINLYQQFIGVKGTLLSTDIFTRANFNKETGQYTILENWGVLVGTYGANANRSYVELRLNEALLTGNPSTVQIIEPGQPSEADQTIKLQDLWSESYKIPTTNIFPTTYTTNLDVSLPSAGYVNLKDADITVFNLNDPSSIEANLTSVGNGTTIWVAQVNSYNWDIYRCVQVPGRMVRLNDNLNQTSVATFSTAHGLSVGDLMVVRYFSNNVDGVFRVLAVPSTISVVIAYSFTNTNQTQVVSNGIAFYLQSMRVAQASDIVNLPAAHQLLPGVKVWVDNNGSGLWEVVEKEDPFVEQILLEPFLPVTNSLFGTSISQSSDHYSVIVGAPGASSGAGALYTYRREQTQVYVNNILLYLTTAGTVGYGNSVSFGNQNWAVAGASASNSNAGYVTPLYQIPGTNDYIQTQLLVAPDQNFGTINFGASVVMSQDEHWMYIGAPGANCVYAYGIVEVPTQNVSYLTDGKTTSFNWSNAIQINPAHPGQLIVLLSNKTLTFGIDYYINSNVVQFYTPPVAAQPLIITRRISATLDQNIYYNVTQNSTSGTGTGATFTVTNTRGTYYPTLSFGGSGYAHNNTLTISYTQVSPTGSSANNLTITVTTVDGTGAITGFTYAGSGVSNTSTFTLNPYLATLSDIYSFTVTVNGVLQRPYIDYTYNGSSTVLTFITVPSAGATISATTGTYWDYINKINVSGLASDALFGGTVATSTDGTQILIGASRDTGVDSTGTTISHAGAVYAFDRTSVNLQVTNVNQNTYSIPGSSTAPVAVLLNGVYLTNTAYYINGQYTISGFSVVLSSSVVLTVGDILTIQTNQFKFVQKMNANVVIDESAFGQAVQICPNDCSLYVGAPLDSTAAPQGGVVERFVNQSRIYGVTTSTIANPTLTAGNTIRINGYQVAVPSGSKQNILGLIAAINSANIPNVVATAVPDVTLTGDGKTTSFYVGSVYSAASSYTTVVYVNGTLLTSGPDYSYNNTTQQIFFSVAPAASSVILVQAGRMTLSVMNADAALPYNKINVLPGVSGTAFADIGFNTFAWVQDIFAPNPTQYARFGSSISVNSNAVNLVVGAPNGNVYEATTFDADTTYFDEHSTSFFNEIFNCGVAYSYDYLPSATTSLSNPGAFVFGQQIYEGVLATGDLYGTAVNYRNGRLLVGAPGSDQGATSGNFGLVSVLDNPTGAPAWTVLYQQQPVVDVSQIDTVYSYNKLLNSTQTYYDFIDPLQGKILGAARRNIDFIGAVDPANYNQGSIHNVGNSWGAEHVGQIWWDTNTVRFIAANQDDLVYASRRWAQIFPGSKVDIYQWIESTVPPSQYTGPGTPLSTISYTIKSVLTNNGVFSTLYYYWVRNISTINTAAGKTLSSTGIASYITNPYGSGIPFIAGINANTVALYNSAGLISATDTILHIGYVRQTSDANIHTEYEFIADGRPSDFLNDNLYRKLQDSLCGVDTAGNLVPDPGLSPGEQYGVQFRPRQSMFVDRFMALQNYLTRANSVLLQYPISETRKFNLLNSAEALPTNSVATSTQCSISGNTLTVAGTITGKFSVGMLVLGNNLVSVAPGTVITGLGTGAGGAGTYTVNISQTVVATNITCVYGWNQAVPTLQVLDYQNLNQVPPGYIYLVESDSSQNGLWTVYQVDLDATGNRTLSLIRIQNYDTKLYWNYVNWYMPGYNSSIQPIATVPNYASLSTLSLTAAPVGSSVKVSANGQGKFEIYLRNATGWERVGLEDGTIQFDESLWNYNVGRFGFDNEVFDAQYFDQDPTTETRKIIQSINEELFIDELLIEKNQLLILMFKFIYSEFTAPNWLMKTSFVSVDHTIRALLPYQFYLQDNQTFVEQYLQEVKPYHTQILEFNLIYDGLDTYAGNMTDFDLPAYYDNSLTFPQFVSPILTPYTASESKVESFVSDAAPNAEIWTQEPWSQWYNNYLLEIMSVNVINGGYGYTVPPVVTVTGSCVTPATMTAVINSAGQVIGINIVNPGYGYTTTAQITLEGGNGYGAIAVAVMGNGLVRSIKTVIKYDRYEYNSSVVEWQPMVAYTQGTLVRYANVVWKATTNIESTVFIPTEWTLVDASTLSGVNRTMGYYTPTPDEPGLSLPLLIDGVEYPGVQVTAPTYNQNTGFDVGNFDVNPFDNIVYSPEGFPTYDPSILDAAYSSSYLDTYLGTRPTDINVDGGAYVDAYSSHAPEELVPGAEFDTLDFRVYTTPGADWTGRGHGVAIAGRRYTYDPANPYLYFGDIIPFPMTVFVFNITNGYGVESDGYDWLNYLLYLDPANPLVAPGDIIQVAVTGTGGGNQLLNATYTGSEVQAANNSITVPFPYSSIYEFVIYIGEYGPLTLDEEYYFSPIYADTGPQAVYSPISSGTNLVVSSVIGISVGSLIFGNGFTQGQTVVSIDGPTSMTISAPPDSTPGDVLTFLADTGSTLIQFTFEIFPIYRVNLTCLGYESNGPTHSYSLPTFQTWDANGSLSVTLTNSLQGTNPANMIVAVNGLRARPPEGIRYISDGSTVTYALPRNGGYSQSLVSDNDVAVYLDDSIQLILGVDYVVDPYVNDATPRTITLSNSVPVGSVILISVRTIAQYWILGDQLQFRPDQGLYPQIGYRVEIVTWNDTSQQGLETQVWIGPITEGLLVSETYDSTNFDIGTVNDASGSFDYSVGTQKQVNVFDTGRLITNAERIFVSLDGYFLFNGEGYIVDGSKIIIPGPAIGPTSTVAITSFTQNVVPQAMAFRIFQDMRGNQLTYRITPETTTTLAQPLSATDDLIWVTNASALVDPNLDENIWGALTINGERIMYRFRNTDFNTVGGLMRGTTGTAAADHAVGATVYNIGLGNLLYPEYQNYIVETNILGDGSTSVFVAENIVTQTLNEAKAAVEVYVGGTLVENNIYNYTIDSYNPVTVNFYFPPAEGSMVTILVRRGESWYNTSGVPLQETDTKAARFLRGL